ncbi:MAG: hypothetical protein JNM78_03675 [Cyclobacteriaceae bacterium]|nr:hypothetical protein [Cyclobacteriaceae bacterium]
MQLFVGNILVALYGAVSLLVSFFILRKIFFNKPKEFKKSLITDFRLLSFRITIINIAGVVTFLGFTILSSLKFTKNTDLETSLMLVCSALSFVYSLLFVKIKRLKD